jgi:hypothetical protein
MRPDNEAPRADSILSTLQVLRLWFYSSSGIVVTGFAITVLGYAKPEIPEKLVRLVKYENQTDFSASGALPIGPFKIDNPSDLVAFTCLCGVAVLLNCLQTVHDKTDKKPGSAAMAYGWAGFAGSVVGYKNGWIPFKYFWGSLNLV